MSGKMKTAALALLFGMVAPGAHGQDPERFQEGERLALSLCIACHGPQGLSTSPIWPSLAGQKYSYLVKSMKDYRSGLRQDPLMTPQAQTLSDRQIDVVAWYYSSLNIQIVPDTEEGGGSEN